MAESQVRKHKPKREVPLQWWNKVTHIHYSSVEICLSSGSSECDRHESEIGCLMLPLYRLLTLFTFHHHPFRHRLFLSKTFEFLYLPSSKFQSFAHRELLRLFSWQSLHKRSTMSYHLSDNSPHNHIAHENQNPISGEEAYLARCSMPPMSIWNPVPMPVWDMPLQPKRKSGNVPYHGVSGMRAFPDTSTTSRKSRPVREDEVISPCSAPPSRLHQVHTSSPRPMNLSRGGSNSARPSVGPICQDTGENQDIPDLAYEDKLDHRIGIRPRGKTSQEVKSTFSTYNKGKKPQDSFPGYMLRITRQFMIANGYVGRPKSSTSASKRSRRRLWRSLLVRLDLHDTESTKTTCSGQSSRLAGLSSKLGSWVEEETKLWKTSGIITRADDVTIKFHPCTQAWTSPDWDGSVAIQGTTTVTSAISSDEIIQALSKLNREDLLKVLLEVKSTIEKHDSTKDLSKKFGDSFGSLSQADAFLSTIEVPERASSLFNNLQLEDDIECNGSYPSKRPSDEEAEKPRAKRRRDSPTLGLEILKTKHCSDPTTDTLAKPCAPSSREQEFPRIIEAVHLAHSLLADIGPTSARDLASLQDDWKNYDYAATLAAALRLGQFHVKAMNKYFDSALELLSILAESNHLKFTDSGVETNCPCEHEPAGSQGLHNGEHTDPLDSLNQAMQELGAG